MHLTSRADQREPSLLMKTQPWNKIRIKYIQVSLCMGFNSTLKLNNPHCTPRLPKLLCAVPWFRAAAGSARLTGREQILSADRAKEGSKVLSVMQKAGSSGMKGLNDLSKIPPDGSIFGNVNAIWGFKHQGMVFLSILLDKSTAYVKYNLPLHHYNLLCSIKINLMSSASFFLLFFFPSP